MSRILMLAAGALLSWMIAEPLAHRTVGRRQRISEPTLIRADDALRSAAAHAVVAVGISLQLLALSTALWAIGAAAGPTLVRWIFPTLAFVAVFTAGGMWFGYAATSFPFKVRRPLTTDGHEASA